MRSFLFFVLLLQYTSLFTQATLLSVGDPFPAVLIDNISNAPVTEINLNRSENKIYILNFWGTWCAPCIPDMDALALLQKKYADEIQVIGISNDDEKRKSNYLSRKPSELWLATDSSNFLYRMLQLAHVGQSAIISPEKKVIALVQTHSINEKTIQKLIKGQPIESDANIKEIAINTEEELFFTDTTMAHAFSIHPYKKGVPSMSHTYTDRPIYKGRRLTWFNVTIGSLYRAAFDIHSNRQEIYDASIDKKDVYDYTSTDKLLCLDILVQAEEKDQLHHKLREQLAKHLPIQARILHKEIDVYVLQRKVGAKIEIKSSSGRESNYSFSGSGFEGHAITIDKFAKHYLTNELELPVINETGLQGNYDITTEVAVRDTKGIIESIERLGLIITKAKRTMPVIEYYK